MPIDILRAGPGNSGLFARIAPGVFDEAVDPERLEAYLLAPGHVMVLARLGDLVVGQCAGVVHRHPDKPAELYVDEVGVADDFLRQGIARRMMASLFDWGRELGCEDAWLGTECDNVPANTLYRALGGAEDTISYYEFKL